MPAYTTSLNDRGMMYHADQVAQYAWSACSRADAPLPARGRRTVRAWQPAEATAATGTLLMDLRTYAEEAIDERTRHLRFDVGLLAERLVATTDWLGRNTDTHTLPVGYFGASTG